MILTLALVLVTVALVLALTIVADTILSHENPRAGASDVVGFFLIGVAMWLVVLIVAFLKSQIGA